MTPQIKGRIFSIVIVLATFTACKTQTSSDRNCITGIWLENDYQTTNIMYITDSTLKTRNFHGQIPYTLEKDSLFYITECFSFNKRDSCIYKARYELNNDTLTLYYNPDNPQVFIRKHAKYYHDDIFNSLGITLNLPQTSFNYYATGSEFISVYLPRWHDEQPYILLNNDKHLLDTTLYKELNKTYVENEIINCTPLPVYIHKNTEFQFVKLLLNELRKAGFFQIELISSSKGEQFYSVRKCIGLHLYPINKTDSFYTKTLVDDCPTTFRPPTYKYLDEAPKEGTLEELLIEIKNDTTLLNGKIFSKDSLYKMIKGNRNVVTKIHNHIDDKSKYTTYYTFISVQKEVLSQILDENALLLFDKKYDQLCNKEKRDQVHDLNPFHTIYHIY
jgi:hypothetical protein